LSYAGWGNRLADEYSVMLDVSPPGVDTMIAALMLAGTLVELDRLDPALEIFRRLSEGARTIFVAEDAEDDEDISHLHAVIDLRLAGVLADKARLDGDELGPETRGEYLAEARALADAAEVVITSGDDSLRRSHAETRFDLARANAQTEEMVHWAYERLRWAEKEDEETRTPSSRDKVSEAHFAIGLAEAFAGDFEKCIEHLSSQLRIKVELGKLPGVAAGLLNLGLLIQAVAPVDGGVMVLISRQMSVELGLLTPGWDEESLREYTGPALEHEDIASHGREIAGNISDRLIPYWERALQRVSEPGA
jgi:hypothetical protein